MAAWFPSASSKPLHVNKDKDGITSSKYKTPNEAQHTWKVWKRYIDSDIYINIIYLYIKSTSS